MFNLSRTSLALVLLSVFACGVSEQRVGVLEQEVKALKTAASSSPNQPGSQSELDKRVATLETTTADALKKMEEMLELLQREVTRLANTPTSSSLADTNFDNSTWAEISMLLGATDIGVVASGDSFKVQQSWLAAQLSYLLASGKAPKLSENKKGGIVIRAIKPKTLPEFLGFKNGDVILSIGGTNVGQPNEVGSTLRKARSPLVVKVLRKNVELSLTYSMVE